MPPTSSDTAVSFAPLGERVLLATAPGAGSRLMAWLSACNAAPLEGVGELVAGFESLAACFDPEVVDVDRVAEWLTNRLARAEPAVDAFVKHLELPVCYDGEDLNRVAEHAGLSVGEVVRRHHEAEYRVRVVGFAPGFPYLEGLPPELHAPRRATPRTSVPAGSVAIGGPYTGVYPDASPGGWNLIGRTPTRLFDARRAEPALLSPGDRVRFTPVECESLEYQANDTPRAPDEAAVVDPVARVLRAGVQTTLQDLGRHGGRRFGVGPSGAMDARSLRLANRLVGAAEGAAALEATLVGPVLEFLRPATVALVGAQADGAVMGRPFPVGVGDRVELNRLSGGARCYVAIAGGWKADLVLGSAATDVRARLGGLRGRPLRDGDELALAASPPRGLTTASGWAIAADLVPRVGGDAPTALRVLRGPQAERFDREAWERFLKGVFRVSPDSSRMGVRLSGTAIEARDRSELASQPVTRGAVQVPPDGSPVVLGADHQTLGGYPLIACVAEIDLALLGQLSPGDEVRFEAVDLPTALALAREEEQRLRVAGEGIRLHG